MYSILIALVVPYVFKYSSLVDYLVASLLVLDEPHHWRMSVSSTLSVPCALKYFVFVYFFYFGTNVARPHCKDEEQIKIKITYNHDIGPPFRADRNTDFLFITTHG
jgi:hypothetical protein